MNLKITSLSAIEPISRSSPQPVAPMDPKTNKGKSGKLPLTPWESATGGKKGSSLGIDSGLDGTSYGIPSMIKSKNMLTEVEVVNETSCCSFFRTFKN